MPKKALLESARPPSPSYLRVWITGPHPLSQGLDPALQTAWPLESATKTSTTTAIGIDENNPAHARKKIPEALPYVEGNILDSYPRSYLFFVYLSTRG